MQLTTSTALSVLAALTASVGAVDINFYPDRGCQGNSLSAFDVGRNLCVFSNDRRFSSVNLSNDNGDSVTGYVPDGSGFACSVPVAEAVNGGCAAESNGQFGGIIGATWQFSFERQPSRFAHKRSETCTKPDHANIDGVKFKLDTLSQAQQDAVVEMVIADAKAADIPADLLSLAL